MTTSRADTSAYRELLARLDAWLDRGRRRYPGVIPCRSGCAFCCRGPFDVTVADVELLREAVARLEPDALAEVERQAGALLGRMETEAPDWTAPHDIADLGDERFDRMAESLAGEPCPLLDPAGRCRVYPDRPLVCRLIGLSMVTPEGRTLENACPIQEEFPAYAALPPEPFDLAAFEVEEIECLRGAARRLLGDAARHDYETTIAAAVVDFTRSPGPSERTGSRSPETSTDSPEPT